MSKSFEHYATRVAFSLQLSKSQIHVMLLALYKLGHNHTGSHFIIGVKGCINRGLMVHHNNHPLYESTGLFAGSNPSYSLTKAGYHTARLLEIAFPQFKEQYK